MVTCKLTCGRERGFGDPRAVCPTGWFSESLMPRELGAGLEEWKDVGLNERRGHQETMLLTWGEKLQEPPWAPQQGSGRGGLEALQGGSPELRLPRHPAPAQALG